MKIGKHIVVGNGKGGVGKSTVSVATSTHYKMRIYGNDPWSPMAKYLNNNPFIGEKLSIFKKVGLNEQMPQSAAPKIYDTGGWADDRMIPIIRSASLLIVPTLPELIDLDTTIRFLKKYSKLTDRIIIVVNKATPKEFGLVQQHLEAHGFTYPMLRLPQSKLFSRVLNQGEPIQSQMSKGAAAWIFRNHYKKFQELISMIDSYQVEAA